jgi:DNA-binding transcriptional LysR family regulator
MIDGIEALIALERTGTISEAAAQLRLTQSAISKRIQSLQNELRFSLIEPDGRRVKLTSRGLLFLEKAKPLVAELKNLKTLKEDVEYNHFTMGLADSVAASWGPKLIRKTIKKMNGIDLSMHVHRSVLVQEHVKLGRYHFGLCTAPVEDGALVSSIVAEEQMVLIPCQLKDRIDSQKQMITIERGSSTWKTIGHQLNQHPRLSSYEYLHVESFSAAIQMAREGFGNALVPLGLAQAVGLPAATIHLLSPVIKREIRFICRKNISLLSVVQEFQDRLKTIAKEVV